MTDRQKVLVYLASGPYRTEYEKLPFDKIILIDYHTFKNDQLGEKVECWSCNVLDAVERLKSRNLKISCLVNLNEGLQEGGGSFVMLSHFMMGYLSPCLLDEFVLVSDLNYYKSVRILGKIKKLDWGFDFTKLTRSDEDFLNPSLFTHKAYRNGIYHEFKSFGEVFRMKRIQNSKSLELNPGVHVQVKQKSIWQDADELDLIGVSISSHSEIFRHRSPNIRAYFLEKQKTLDIKGLSMIEILDYCEKNEIQSLGLMPWMDGNYGGVIEAIKQYTFTFLKKITFYHLSKKDYAQLYAYPNEIDQNKTKPMKSNIVNITLLFDSMSEEQQSYAIENEFPYIYSKASTFLKIGAELYRKDDFFHQPPADFDEEDIAILQHGCRQVIAGIGMSAENPFKGLDVAGFSALMELFHFQSIGRKTNHGKVFNDEKGALDCIKFKHMVDGRICEYFNFCVYPKFD